MIVDGRGVPNVYEVKRGDTVSQIAARYGINWRDVARLNRLDESNTIYTGQWLVLWKGSPVQGGQATVVQPTVRQNATNPSLQVQTPSTPKPNLQTQTVQTTVVQKVQPQPAVSTHNAHPAPMPTPPPNTNHASLVGSTGLMQFVYPVTKQSKIVRHFGDVRQVNGVQTKTEGMWFNGQVGDAIMASRAGTVIYADANNMQNASISIRHADGFTSEYRFIKDATVKQGQNVAAGQRIASMKESNGAVVTEFRILKGSVYIDPLSVLK